MASFKLIMQILGIVLHTSNKQLEKNYNHLKIFCSNHKYHKGNKKKMTTDV